MKLFSVAPPGFTEALFQQFAAQERHNDPIWISMRKNRGEKGLEAPQNMQSGKPACAREALREKRKLDPFAIFSKIFSSQPYPLQLDSTSNSPLLHSHRLSSPPQARPSRSSTVTVNAAARPLWRPGSKAPAWLDGSLPGDFGFDPLALGEQPAALKWYVQGELQNARWAMLGAAGVLFQNLLDVLNAGGPAGQVPWFESGAYTYFAPASSLFIAQLFLFAFVEARRYQDYLKPGSANQDPIFTGNKLPDGNKPG